MRKEKSILLYWKRGNKLFNNFSSYEKDIHLISSNSSNWDEFENKKILITGATGLIGAFLIDLLMYRNIKHNNKIFIYAVGRNKEKALLRFAPYFKSEYFTFVEHDIKEPFEHNFPVDFIIHGASNTHPIAYSTEPINTILLSVLGTKTILDFASINKCKQVVFLSTVEVYGENRGDTEMFSEDYCGYINSNTLRAGYPEGKRAAEALCQAYSKEKNVNITIARICRVYGPTMGNDDSKAIAQFIRNAVNKENIILKSKGEQQFSYCYAADVCSALLTLLLKGKNGEAYNIAGTDFGFSLFEIAKILSDYAGTKVVFDIPSSIESSGYSKVTKALLNTSKLKALGWQAHYSIKEGLTRTVDILRQAKNE